MERMAGVSAALHGILLGILNRRVRTNVLLTRLLFGVRVDRYPRIHWDWTTLLLRRCLVRHTRPGGTVLEIGAGPFAILSIYLSRRVQVRVTAVEINPAHAHHARAMVSRHAAPVCIVKSDLFESVHDRYDLIFFNAVYIPRQIGVSFGIDAMHEYETDWCGGESGMDTIRRFLRDAPAFLKPGGEILLGFNTMYLPEDRITPVYGEHGFNLRGRCTSMLNPSHILILSRNKE
jgi:methylase of polypeptide subunit release factors